MMVRVYADDALPPSRALGKRLPEQCVWRYVQLRGCSGHLRRRLIG